MRTTPPSPPIPPRRTTPPDSPPPANGWPSHSLRPSIADGTLKPFEDAAFYVQYFDGTVEKLADVVSYYIENDCGNVHQPRVVVSTKEYNDIRQFVISNLRSFGWAKNEPID